MMNDAMADALQVQIRKRRGGIALVRLEFANAGLELTADGQVAVLGLVHHILARWLSRAGAGREPRPPGWPDPSYEYVPAALSFPVLEREARAVADTLSALLRRPGMVKRLEALPGEQAAGRSG